MSSTATPTGSWTSSTGNAPAKLAEFQERDLDRYRKAYEDERPNHPERVSAEQLQLAFGQVLEMFADSALC